MRRKKKSYSEGGGSPGWMTTFSDLMTLLLTFFILLYSFSTLDAIMFKNVANALQSVLQGESRPSIFPNEISTDQIITLDNINIPNEDIETIDNELNELYNYVKNYVVEENLDKDISVKTNVRGVIIDINEKVLFDSGSDVLKEESKFILEKLSNLINEFDNELIIEGHTDNNPINTVEFNSNWELSVIRAVNVVRYFTEVKGISTNRISASGYGEYKPIQSNATEIGRMYNRRVNILILVDSEGES